MLKTTAIELLGGTVASAAKAVKISFQAVDKWPDVLPDRIADRVLAAQARKHLAPELIGEAPQPDAQAAAPATKGLTLMSPQAPRKLAKET